MSVPEYKPTKLELALMALVMADGWLAKAKRYAKGEYIRQSVWEQAQKEYHKENKGQ